MGPAGSKAKARSEVVNDFSSKSIAESIMNCTNQSSISQTIDIRGNFNVVKNVDMKQAFNLSSSCYQDAKNMNNLVNDISNSISQSAEAQNIAMMGALGESKSDVDLFLYNGVSNEISASTIQNIVNQTNAEQGISIHGNHNIVSDISMNQVVDMISDNAQSSLNQTDVANKARNIVEQAAKAKMDNPLDFITDMMKALMDGMMAPFKMVIAIVGVIALIFLYLFFGPSKGGGGNPQGMQMMQMMQKQKMMQMMQKKKMMQMRDKNTAANQSMPQSSAPTGEPEVSPLVETGLRAAALKP
jgi:hypothetical protein